MLANRIILLAFAMFGLCGCFHDYTSSYLYITNDTDIDLYVESNVVSELSDDVVCVALKNYGSMATGMMIARSKRYQGDVDGFDISDLVWNEDAYVKVYDISGCDTVFLKEWKYSEKDNPGRQLFDLSDCEMNGYHSVEGRDEYWGYYFSIRPEDMLK